MKRALKIGIVLLALSLALVGCTSSKKSDNIKVIGIIKLVTHPALDAALSGMTDYLTQQGYDETKVKIIIKNADGKAENADLIAKQFVSDGVDLIYAIATISAQAAFNATKDNGIPVVFNAVTDAVAAGIVTSNENPGANVTGVSDAAPLGLQLALIKEMLPNAKKIGLMYNLGEVNGKIQVDQVKSLAPGVGLETVIIGVTNNDEIASATSQLANEVDVIYNVTDNLIVTATPLITDKATAAGIPVFAAENGGIGQGILAVDGLSYEKLGNQAGPIVVDILFNGKKPADIAVTGASDTALEIDVKVAEHLGITIPDALMSRATLH
jgi:putative ABC transport system substrate-binding protein